MKIATNWVHFLKLMDLIIDLTDCRMTKVQSDTIEHLLHHKDMHIISKTGSGKTGAFLIPSIQHIIKNPLQSSIRMLVVSPTRELDLQIAKEANLFTGRLNHLNVGVVIGGTNMKKETSMLRKKLDILIATPGRLLDHLNENIHLLKDTSIFVLDECDRLHDMGH
jgi:superfamily II DNA/RNA helicase